RCNLCSPDYCQGPDLTEVIALHIGYSLCDLSGKVCEKRDHGEDEEQGPNRIHCEASIEERQSDVEAYNRISYQASLLSLRVLLDHKRKSEKCSQKRP